jgi:aminoglycoside 6-adenylyltransferase
MNSTAEADAEIERRFTAWAKSEADLRGAVVIGSRARQDHPADQWSDLDSLVDTRDTDRLRDRWEWVAEFGRVTLTIVEQTPDGRSWERRGLYAGGRGDDGSRFQRDWAACQSQARSLAMEGTRSIGRLVGVSAG